MTGVRVEVEARAKLTLAFRVLGLRDDGFHEVEGVMASLTDPVDLVEVTSGSAAGSIAVTGRTDGVPGNGSNLAARALDELVGMQASGLRLRIHKDIPAGAGLGGGSADAAAALRAVASIRPEAGGRVDAVAQRLGSDVPFCLAGGLARVTGRGETVESLPAVEGWWVTVAVPGISVSTPAVYAAWDRLGGPRSDRVVDAPGSLAPVVRELVNDLEPAALAVAPELGDFRDRLEAVAAAPALLAGSGSAYFVMFDDPARAEAVARAAHEFSLLAVAARPSDAGVRVTRSDVRG